MCAQSNGVWIEAWDLEGFALFAAGWQVTRFGYGVPRPYFQATPGPPSPLPFCASLSGCSFLGRNVEASKPANRSASNASIKASTRLSTRRATASVRSCLFRTAASIAPAPSLSISIRSITPSRLPSRLLSPAHCLPLPVCPLAYLSPLPGLCNSVVAVWVALLVALLSVLAPPQAPMGGSLR